MKRITTALSALSTIAFAAQAQEQPNILWLTCEDISPYLSMYGDRTANTPNIDALAQESMVFTNVYATVGVSAPARSSIITGMYPASIGTHQMRTGHDYSSWGERTYLKKTNAVDINGDTIPQYAAVIPPDVKCFPEYLRAVGYFCTNNQKTDYQFAAPVSAWDQNNSTAHWKNRNSNQPFFSVYNHEVTHESRVWMNSQLPQTVSPDSVPLPPYYPDNKVVREDVARNYSNIELLDAQIGAKIQELKEAGLYEQTIIFFYSDHGGPLPRGKREVYNSGLRVPFMVRFPHGENAGVYDELVSFVDLAPTVLSLAGVKPPEHLQGRAFLGEYENKEPRDYIFGSGDRFDNHSDMVRCVSDGEFMYVRNFHPEKPGYKNVAYRLSMDLMKNLIALRDSNLLDPVQMQWFNAPRPAEELYHSTNDPFHVFNLAVDTSYHQTLARFRTELAKWQTEIDDLGFTPELEMIHEMWPDLVQPTTLTPVIKLENETVKLSCETDGASIVYLLSDEAKTLDLNSGWQLYSEPIRMPAEAVLYVMAARIGYKDSEIVNISTLKPLIGENQY